MAPGGNVRWAAVALVVAFGASGASAQPGRAVADALADCLRQPAGARPYLRYLSTENVPAGDRATWEAVVSLAVNSLSRGPVVARVPAATPTLLRVDLRDYKIPTTAWDRLGELGSGRAPVPEPYYHRVTQTREVKEEVRQEWWPAGTDKDGRPYPAGYYPTRYRQKGAAKALQAHGGWLPKDDLVTLVAMTESEQPVYRADWFAYYALLEPRYHELLALGDKEDDFRKLGAADEKAADDEGAQARGAVVFSEVAPNNRILQRTPTLRLYGRGWYWRSFDFGSSVSVSDVLASADAALSDRSDAHEIIASLKNGLQAYFLSDGKGNRLDRAAVEVARDTRNGFRSVEVEIRNCFACHGPKGMIPVDDEVRAAAKQPLAAAAGVLKEKDARQAERFLEKYAAAPLDELLKADALQYQQAVRQATGLESAAAAAALTKFQKAYESPLSAADMARECGCSEKELSALVPRVANVDSHVAAAVGAGRRARRDQWESTGFPAVMEALTAAKGGK